MISKEQGSAFFHVSDNVVFIGPSLISTYVVCVIEVIDIHALICQSLVKQVAEASARIFIF